MTVGDLKLMLEQINDEVMIMTCEGKEYAGVCLFIDLDGNVCLQLE